MALAEGVDIVLELPVVYATQHAQGFASGAVQLLAATGVVDYLVFGSEHGKISELEGLAHFLLGEGRDYQRKLRTYLNSGLPFPAARDNSLMDIQRRGGIPGLEHLSSQQVYSLLRHPNNILALEYLQALLRSQSNIRPITIPRLGAGYHEENIGKTMLASARAIRSALQAHDWRVKLPRVMPQKPWGILQGEIDAGRAPIFLNSYQAQIINLIRRTPSSALGQIAGIREGLENRLKRAANSCGTIECIGKVKTKRHPSPPAKVAYTFVVNRQGRMPRTSAPSKPCYLRPGLHGRQLLPPSKGLLPQTRPARHLGALICNSKWAARMWNWKP